LIRRNELNVSQIENMNINNYNNYFFIGVAGTGMSAIAQYLAGTGKKVAGSDRQFKKGERQPVEIQLNNEGVDTFLQDGSGINNKTEIFVVSTAIEESNVEYQKALKLKIPIVHRADLLAAICRTKKTIAVSGTSGKSTTSAMICHIMEQAGKPISFIGGAGLVALQENGKIGNAIAADSDWLVIEADESDGSLVKYEPEIGIILNIDKDHKEISELEAIFATFKKNTKGKLIVNQSHARTKMFSENLDDDFGIETKCGFNATDFCKEGFKINFKINGVSFEVPVLGQHNMENAVAAVAACYLMGVPIEESAKALKKYKGIYRRHQLIGQPGGVYLIDDYAHNPAKLAASIKACQFPDSKLIVWFQPHGFTPTKFLRTEFVKEISEALREQDEVWMSEIYYAGGTVTKDISANDLIQDIKRTHPNAYFIEDRKELPSILKQRLKNGDVLLLTGARDPSLADFASFVYNSLK
jgi:UDP-N-acetylmuramate--alanine ligase